MRAKKSFKESVPSRLYCHAARLPIETIVVVGAGGTGSIFMSHLCRIWQAWTKLGGSPFAIELWDDDQVSEANLARQVFCEADIGQPKALVIAHRLRSFFGVPVTPAIDRFSATQYAGRTDRVLYVGCVDNLAGRHELRQAAARWAPSYWLDMGNTDNAGQVVLGGHGLPNFFDIYPDLEKAKDPKNLPSCSMAEALSRQDLFINSTIATLGGQLLWQLMRHGGLNHHGYIVNLREGITLPLRVPEKS